MENKHLIVLGSGVLVTVLVVLLVVPSSKVPNMDQNTNPFGIGSDANNNTPLTPSPAPSPITELQGQDISVGTGSAVVAVGNTITVNYIGALANGTVFDNSYSAKQPFTFTVGAGSVIQGFEQGVVGMKLGGKRKILIPSNLGYGDKAQGPIPANSVLVFQIELINIAPKATDSATLNP